VSGRFNLSAARLELLQTMLRAEGIDRAPTRTVTPRADRTAPAPLTFSQNRLWFLDQFAEHDSAYVISAALRVHGPLRFDVFAEACAEVARRHESLRTVFVELDGRPCQVVRDELAPELRVVDLRGTAAGEVVAEVQRREAELIARPFDLAAGPLFRVELLQLGPDDAAVLLNLHHIVSDRWSMGVLMRELTQVYGALLTGAAANLPELPVQYPDFAGWQQGASFEATWEAELAYWLRQLRGTRSDTGLPTDRPRPKEKTYRGSSVPVELAPALVARLRELARAEGATPFMVLIAAFSALLARLGDNDTIVIGTPVANRTLVELEPLIGLFVNTLALRTDASGNPTFREMLRRVSRVCLDAYAHQHMPFERLVEQLQPERSLAATPVFQVLLSYQNVPFPAWQQGPVRIEPIALESRKAEFDLLLDLFEDGDTVWGRLEYSTDLFTRATAERLARLLVRLLSAAVIDPDRPIAGLPLVTEADQRLAAEVNATGRQWPGVGWVHESVAEHARRAPDATAVTVDGRNISYGELNRRANQLANRLRRVGVGPEVVVAVVMPSSLELLVSLVALAKAGAAHLRLDPDTPPGRVAALLSGGRMLLTLRSVAAHLPALDVPVLCVEELEHLLATQPDEDPGVVIDGAQASYLVHAVTPDDRVVTVTHTVAGLRDRLLWLRDSCQMRPDDRVLHHAAPGTDAALLELLTPLVCGATVVLTGTQPATGTQPGTGAAPGTDPDRAARLARAARQDSVTALLLDPPTLAALLDQPDLEHAPLRRVIWTGGQLPRPVQETFFARFGARLHTLHGPVEAGGAALWWTCQRAGGPPTAPLGHPVANTRAHVLDRFLQPVGCGVPGELYLDAPGLARGYAGDPELTAQRLVPDPFVPRRRLLRTGELVRRRDDGSIEALGRLDRRVTVRGFRVDPGELEAVLASQPEVRRAAVVARSTGTGGTRLVAYAETGEQVTGAWLLEYLRQRVPEYLVPVTVVTLPRLPLLSGGVVDRTALPEFEVRQRGVDYVSPRGDLESVIAGVWSQVLNVPDVGAYDNFFDLGGHSLLATKVVTQLKTGHGMSVPLRALFENPTVAELAAWIADQAVADRAVADQASTAAEDPIPVADRAAGVPLGFAQQVLCEHHPLGPRHPQHNVVTSLMAHGPLDEQALRRSLDAMVARHEPLRTRFARRPTGWVQLMDPVGTWPLTVLDLRGVDGPARDLQLRGVVESEGLRPFAIDQEPPMRAVLVRTGTDEHAVVLVLHHLITDNWSYGVLVRDLCELYRAHTQGGPPHLPALDRHYADVVAWQHARLADGTLDDRIAYWRTQLADLPPAPAFTAEGQVAATGYSGTFAIDTARAEALRALGRRAGASLFMILMAAFDVLLSAHSGRDDVLVAFPEAGRDRPETEHLLGYFVSYLLVRADLTGDPTFRELVGQVRAKTLDGYSNRGVPLWRLDGVAGPGDSPFRIVFNLLNAPIPDVTLHGLRTNPLDLGGDYVFREVSADLAPAGVDLALILREDGEIVHGMWLYSLDRLDPVAVATLIRRWPRLIELVTDHPDQHVSWLRRAVREA
jgi:non-ribosomal peptide synthetase component F/NRPS condensation-like uncharacterized protein